MVVLNDSFGSKAMTVVIIAILTLFGVGAAGYTIYMASVQGIWPTMALHYVMLLASTFFAIIAARQSYRDGLSRKAQDRRWVVCMAISFCFGLKNCHIGYAAQDERIAGMLFIMYVALSLIATLVIPRRVVLRPYKSSKVDDDAIDTISFKEIR